MAPTVESLTCRPCRIPTDGPESDGTLEWDSTTLVGRRRDGVAAYGSGGFTSYSLERLESQLGDWVAAGLSHVKMKVGRDPAADAERVAAARDAIGPEATLMVDANGAYSRKQALAMARRFADCGVTWFEEPVSSDDLDGLRLLRDRVPAGMEITAGEYGYDAFYFRRMLEAGAVDVLQVDATRCAGFTGLIRVASLAAAHGIPLSAHTAPALHTHVCCAVPGMRHVEYFHDHVRIEQHLFDGVPCLEQGLLRPEPGRSGMGFSFDQAAAADYSVDAHAA